MVFIPVVAHQPAPPSARAQDLARRLKDHSLLQAIARVNRLYEDESGSKAKDFGYVIDYVGVLGEPDQALTTYSALEGFEAADLEGALTSIHEETRALAQRHADDAQP